MANSIHNKSDLCTVMRTKCHKCGLDGYIFRDQLPNGVELYIGDFWYAKCCDGRARGERKAECKYFVESARANRLQNIRRRGTSMNENARANFD